MSPVAVRITITLAVLSLISTSALPQLTSSLQQNKKTEKFVVFQPSLEFPKNKVLLNQSSINPIQNKFIIPLQKRILNTNLGDSFVLSSRIVEYWNRNTNNWRNFLKAIFSYDQNGNLVEMLQGEWCGNAWCYLEYNSYTYDSSGYLVTFLYQFLDRMTGGWRNHYIHFYKYDAKSNLILDSAMRWENNMWQKASTCKYTYNENSLKIEEIRQEWVDNLLINYSKSIMEYDSVGHIIDSVLQVWYNDTLTNALKVTSVYDDNGMITQRFWQYWIENEWFTNQIYYYSYNPNGSLREWLRQTWRDSVWIDYDKNMFEYNDKGHLIAELYQCSYGTDVLDTISLTQYSYDNYDNLVEEFVQSWNSGEWSPLWRITYIWYRPILNADKEGIADGGGFKLFENYPNPFNPSTTIKYALPQASHVSLSVYNTLGQRVALLIDGKQESGYHEVNFNASGLTSGVYFYRIQASEQNSGKTYIETKKLLLMK